MIKTILKALLIVFACILAPVVLLLLIGTLTVAWPIVVVLGIISIPALVIGVVVGSKSKR